MDKNNNPISQLFNFCRSKEQSFFEGKRKYKLIASKQKAHKAHKCIHLSPKQASKRGEKKTKNKPPLLWAKLIYKVYHSQKSNLVHSSHKYASFFLQNFMPPLKLSSRANKLVQVSNLSVCLKSNLFYSSHKYASFFLQNFMPPLK